MKNFKNLYDYFYPIFDKCENLEITSISIDYSFRVSLPKKYSLFVYLHMKFNSDNFCVRFCESNEKKIPTFNLYKIKNQLLHELQIEEKLSILKPFFFDIRKNLHTS